MKYSGYENPVESGKKGSRQIKKISIITPCYNAERYIAESVRSVLDNTMIKSGALQLQYILCDGGSSDGTLAIVQDVFAALAGTNAALELISEADAGMYDALAKGLRLANGEVCAYINAGDIYSLTAFEVVVELLSRNEISWITGINAWYNERSHLIDFLLPYRYRRRLIQCGMYGTVLPFIQQESTFWRTELHSAIDLDRLAAFRYAGDYFLWNSFSQTTELYVVSAWLGGFRHHRGQLSENIAAYHSEMNAIAVRPSIADYFVAYMEKLFWLMPERIKRGAAGPGMVSFDHGTQTYL